jgi:hypothetical protein
MYRIKLLLILLLIIIISFYVIKMFSGFLIKRNVEKRISYIISVFIVVFIIYYSDIYYLYARMYKRTEYYNLAKNRTKETNRPLIVVGNPNSGPTNKIIGRLYDCGDYTIDINGSECPNTLKGDLVEQLKKFPNNCCVIYISYVLEYIDNIDEAVKEIYRVAGDSSNIFIVHAQNNSKISRVKYSSGYTDPHSRYVIDTAPPEYDKITFHKIKEYL